MVWKEETYTAEFVANCITVGEYTVYLHVGIELVPRKYKARKKALYTHCTLYWICLGLRTTGKQENEYIVDSTIVLLLYIFATTR